MKTGYSTITLRIYYKDWQKIRRAYPQAKNESASKYMERVASELFKVNGKDPK